MRNVKRSPNDWKTPEDIRRGRIRMFPVMRGMNPWNMTDDELADHLGRWIRLYDDPNHPGSWMFNVRQLIGRMVITGYDSTGIYYDYYRDGSGGMPEDVLQELLKQLGPADAFVKNVREAATKFGRNPEDPYGERTVTWENRPTFPGNDRPLPET